MAKICLTIMKNKQKSDGTYNIKFKISNGTSNAYIASAFSVDSTQWNGVMVVRHPNASYYNTKLIAQLNKYQNKLDELDPPAEMKAATIAELIKGDASANTYFLAYTDRYIAKLDKNRQKSYAANMRLTRGWFQRCFGDHMRLKDITSTKLEIFEGFMLKNNQSSTTANIRMTHIKAILNAAVNEGVVEYKVFPFRNYHMPEKNVRDLCISHAELEKLRTAKFSGTATRRYTIARDLFMLSFYCGGINLTDLVDAIFNSEVLTFIRKKTATKKKGANKEVSITIQPEAREIVNKYIGADGKLHLGYKYSSYKDFSSFVTYSLNRIGVELGFEKRLMFYSARKTFVQYGYELGIPLFVLEYTIGQTIKEANHRPVFNYLKVMRYQADLAIRTIINYSLKPDRETTAPIPSWAQLDA